MWVRVVVAIVLSLLPPAAFAQTERRIALLIGNSEYKNTPRLENPKNDAADMAAQLKKLGFAVVEGYDLDKAGMDRTIRDFAEALAGAHVGLFFYAGHGLQVGGQNYLVPIDAKLTTASAIDFEMVRLDLVHRTMERETNTNILIMDACRDNPLARNLARALGTRSTQIGHGLAAVESGEGTLISFSTQPGNVALDGAGRNSPYAAGLLKHIATPGDDLPTILINVRNDVMQATNRRQVPWEHSALTAKFYFIPPKPTAQQFELTFWTSVEDSTSPAVLGTYLERYPAGEFAPIARALIEHYDRQLKLELAALERERKRQEEEMKAAEARRLEEEQRFREAALAEERKHAAEAKNTEEAQRLDKEMVARNEELRKSLEEVRIAREAAKAAEEQRLAAVKAAEKAAKTAEQTHRCQARCG
jgi:caspase domain-containing protein